MPTTSLYDDYPPDVLVAVTPLNEMVIVHSKGSQVSTHLNALPEAARDMMTFELAAPCSAMAKEFLARVAANGNGPDFSAFTWPNQNVTAAEYQEYIAFAGIIMMRQKYVSVKVMASTLSTAVEKTTKEVTWHVMAKFFNLCHTHFHAQVGGGAGAPAWFPNMTTPGAGGGAPALFTDDMIHKLIQLDISNLRMVLASTTTVFTELNKSLQNANSSLFKTKSWATKLCDDVSTLKGPEYQHYPRLFMLFAAKTRCDPRSLPDPSGPCLKHATYTVQSANALGMFLCAVQMKAIRKDTIERKPLDRDALYEQALAPADKINDALVKTEGQLFEIRKNGVAHARVGQKAFIPAFEIAASKVVDEVLNTDYAEESKQLDDFEWYTGTVTTTMQSFVHELNALVYDPPVALPDSIYDQSTMTFYEDAMNTNLQFKEFSGVKRTKEDSDSGDESPSRRRRR